MEKQMSKKKVNILYLSILFFYAFIAIVAFFFASLSEETIFEHGRTIGVMLALSSAPYLLIFVLQDGFNNPKKAVYAAFGIIGIVLGITCLLLETAEIEVLDTICMIRGIFDIVRLTIVLTDIIPTICTEKKYEEIAELAVSIGETIIAVFLIIDGFDGVRTHFFYMGCAFVALFVKFLVVRIVGIIKDKNETRAHRN